MINNKTVWSSEVNQKNRKMTNRRIIWSMMIIFCGFIIWFGNSNLISASESTTEGVAEQATEEYIEGNQDTANSVDLALTAQAVILMEMSTGKVIYEENADLQLAPASVTKIMTLILIFDALESGKITLEDSVTVSEYAASMGGSQIYLEVGEVQTVDTMIKAITVSSANDACVAMAEYISGTADAFVAQMNERAEGLGMVNTNFVNCNGLDIDGHVTTARDIALMSQEIMTKYPQIQDYTTIWMEDITHVTSKGESIFGLSNTNRLLQEYAYTTGLKTGSTDEALFCISATASKDDIDLIAVIMAAPTSADRTSDAITLLDYGFSVTQKYEDESQNIYDDIPIINGVEEVASGIAEDSFTYVETDGNDVSMIEKNVTYLEEIEAPIIEGQKIGSISYSLNGMELGAVDLVAMESIEQMSFRYALLELIPQFLL